MVSQLTSTWRKIISPVMIGVKNRTRKHQLPQKTGKKALQMWWLCQTIGKRIVSLLQLMKKPFAYNNCCQTLNQEASTSSNWKESPTNAMIVANYLKKEISAHLNWRNILIGVKNRTTKYQLPLKTGKKHHKRDDCGKWFEKELSACFNSWKTSFT